MVTERPRMVRFRAVSVVAALVVVAVSFIACSQGVGERCELTSDCDEGLRCVGGDTVTNFMGGTCMPPTTGMGTGGSGGDTGGTGGGGAGGGGGDSGGTGGGAGDTGGGGGSGGGGTGGAAGGGGASGSGSGGVGGDTGGTGGASGTGGGTADASVD
jgi:hypothetical protein